MDSSSWFFKHFFMNYHGNLRRDLKKLSISAGAEKIKPRIVPASSVDEVKIFRSQVQGLESWSTSSFLNSLFSP